MPNAQGKYQQTNHDEQSDKTKVLTDAGIKNYQRYEAIADIPELERILLLTYILFPSFIYFFVSRRPIIFWQFKNNYASIWSIMVIIKQAFEHSCILACFQSFLADNHITYTQSNMINDFPGICGKGTKIEGGIHTKRFDELAQKININSETITVFLPSLSPPKETIFILTTNPVFHCVRFHYSINDKEFWVMNPRLNMGCEKFEFEKWDIERLLKSNPILKKLTLQTKRKAIKYPPIYFVYR